jgi:adenine-specific DNA-methyltransferase
MEYTCSVRAQHRHRLGQYFTPVEIARFMAVLSEPSIRTRRILDAGAGTGILACAVCEALPAGAGPIHIDAYEIDPQLAALCVAALRNAEQQLHRRGIGLTFDVKVRNFILENADALQPHLFTNADIQRYDIAVANPPYFKLRKHDPVSVAAAPVVHGQPNIYALFMAVMASILREGGRMVTITPRSFATGPYFKQFRKHFFSSVVPTTIHLFGSRKDAFQKDDVLQENVIVSAQRARFEELTTVEVSASSGLSDLDQRQRRRVPVSQIVDIRSRNFEVHVPALGSDDEIVRYVRRWPHSLHSLGLEVSTGPVVAFRAEEFIVENPKSVRSAAPLLWLQNVQAMQVTWPSPRCRKPQFIKDCPESRKLLVANQTYVLLRRFTAKEERRRLTVAPLLQCQLKGRRIGLENHLNYIYCPAGVLSDRAAIGLAALLGSSLLDRYLRVSNGHTQVNAEDLRAMPLPELSLIEAIGLLVEEQGLALADADHIVAAVLRLPKNVRRILNGQAD